MTTVRRFAIWCPLGSVCSKKGKRCAVADSEEECRSRLRQHFFAAPAHADLPDEEKESYVNIAAVESWEEQQQETAQDQDSGSHKLWFS